MSYFVGGTVLASTLVSGYSSKRASDKSAEGTKKGLEQSGALAAKSLNNAVTLYNQARTSGQRGLTSAFNFYKDAAPAKYQPFIQGNVAAQNAIGQGAAQANNAILGLPVDMSFAQPQQVNPDLSMLKNAQLPEMSGEYLPAEQPAMGPAQAQGAKSGGLMSGSKLDKIEDPLGLKDPLSKKIESISPGRKLIKKLF